MKTTRPKSFLLVDDHPAVVTGLKTLLDTDFPNSHFYTAGNGLEALETLAIATVDIVLLDLSMPVMDGYETYPRIRSDYPQTSVILLTQFTGEAMLQHFIRQNACSILSKRNTDELTPAIMAVWNTGHYVSAEIKSSIESTYGAAESSLPLSDRDRTLTQLIAQGKSSKEIANIIFLSENTVNSYRQALLRKTQTKNTDELIAFAFQNGLLTL